MIYDLDKDHDVQKFKEHTNLAIDKKVRVELKQKRLKRSFSQNAYLHLILSYFANEYGDSLDFVKQYFFKEVVNPDLFKIEYENKKQGYKRIEWRSSADLDSKEMTIAIDKFRHYSIQEAGIYLPEASQTELINHIEKLSENYGRY